MIEPRAAFMQLAIAMAEANRKQGAQPIGAVIVRGEQVLAQAATTLRWECDPTCHAEINAMRAACKLLGSRYLENCILYSTFEPCPMCASAAVWAKMKGIVFGALISDQTEHARQRIDISASFVAERGQPQIELCAGYLREECLGLLVG